MKPIDVDVKVSYKGIDFLVSGEYILYKAGTPYNKNGDPGDPPDGGYFDDWVIYIDDVDVTDLVNDAKWEDDILYHAGQLIEEEQ